MAVSIVDAALATAPWAALEAAVETTLAALRAWETAIETLVLR